MSYFAGSNKGTPPSGSPVPQASPSPRGVPNRPNFPQPPIGLNGSVNTGQMVPPPNFSARPGYVAHPPHTVASAPSVMGGPQAPPQIQNRLTAPMSSPGTHGVGLTSAPMMPGAPGVGPPLPGGPPMPRMPPSLHPLPMPQVGVPPQMNLQPGQQMQPPPGQPHYTQPPPQPGQYQPMAPGGQYGHSGSAPALNTAGAYGLNAQFGGMSMQPQTPQVILVYVCYFVWFVLVELPPFGVNRLLILNLMNRHISTTIIGRAVPNGLTSLRHFPWHV